jgi:hypothetical protein
MRWVLTAIVAPVLVGVAVWWSTTGIENTWKSKPYSVGGSWHYVMTSDVDNRTRKGDLHLTMEREIVSGKFVPFDDTDSAVQGTFVGDTLSFERQTKLDGHETDQSFLLTKENDSRFRGSYKNSGYYKDSGTIVIDR